MFSNVPMNRIFSMHDRESIYTIPDAMRAARLDGQILSILDMHERVDPTHEDRARGEWKQFTQQLLATRRHQDQHRDHRKVRRTARCLRLDRQGP